MATANQDNAFAEMIKDDCIDEVKISRSALDNAIEWIGKNLDPDDVFDTDKLKSWALNNGFKNEE